MIELTIVDVATEQVARAMYETQSAVTAAENIIEIVRQKIVMDIKEGLEKFEINVAGGTPFSFEDGGIVLTKKEWQDFWQKW